MADLAGLHQVLEHGKRLGDRRFVRRSADGIGTRRYGADARRIGAPGNVPFRPVDLIEVEIVGAELGQRFVDGVKDIGAHQLRRPVAAKPGVGGAADDLGGKDHLVAVALGLHPAADDLFGPPLRLCLGRDRVEFGGVDEIDAARKGQVHLGVAFGLGVLLAPGHRTQADLGDKKIGPTETAFVHGILLRREGWRGCAGGSRIYRRKQRRSPSLARPTFA